MNLIVSMAISTISLLLGALGAWLVYKFAFSLGFIDMPCVRSSHKHPTPKGGGFGILLAFALSSLILGITHFIWLPLVAISIVSLIGDRIDLSPMLRLFFQFLVALLLVYTLLEKSPFISNIINRLSIYSMVVNISIGFLTTVFLVGTGNFYNFMDGINGIAAITGIVAFGFMAAHGYIEGCDERYIILCIALSMACLGFLPFNFPVAKVFMGDVGSVLLGFTFASMALLMSNSIRSFFVTIGFLFPFYADELITMVERARDGQSFIEPHRRHLYQVLANEARLPHWKVSFAYGCFQLAGGIIFWLADSLGPIYLAAAMLIILSIFLYINYKIKTIYTSCYQLSYGDRK